MATGPVTTPGAGRFPEEGGCQCDARLSLTSPGTTSAKLLIALLGLRRLRRGQRAGARALV